MNHRQAQGLRAAFVWGALALAIAVPLLVAAGSPLLAWRRPVYIVAGFAGIAAMGVLLLQPLLATSRLPGLHGVRGRRMHRRAGTVLVLCILVHVAGLWITSPPDVVDALLFRSPTPFSAWGVIPMWALFAMQGMAVTGNKTRRWHLVHRVLAVVVVVGSVVHALLIEGTMGTASKALLCGLVVLACGLAVLRHRIRAPRLSPRRS